VTFEQSRANPWKISKLIPIAPSKFGDAVSQGIVTLNNAMDQWAKDNTQAQSPITLVDNFTGFNTTTDTEEGEHPNAAGDKKMADKFLQPTIDAIKSVSGLQQRDGC
jgi:hypothetical protein